MAAKVEKKNGASETGTGIRPGVSVVIGFRDWGLDRLTLAIDRLKASVIDVPFEVIVSDYGSKDEAEVREAVEGSGAIVARTPREGPWSRSRALNAGVLASDTEYVITTDADMIFTKGAVQNIVTMLEDVKNTAFLVQCRDLTQDYGADQARSASDAELERNSLFRPRWGMGGLIAFRRSDFDFIGGYDARMEIYGGEDIDFAQRLQRAGVRLNWIDDPKVRIFHIWHPSTREAVQQDAVQRAAQELNREIMLNDPTWIRNINIGGRAEPVASVLIATHNREDYVAEALNSVLAQSVEDIEIIVMDDGSSDNTYDVVVSFDDPRISHSRHENKGVAHTRNKLVSLAKSSLIVVHDDDDIMLPWRIEAHLETLRDDVAATYGGWIDFENGSGTTGEFPGKSCSPEAFMYAGSVLSHGTSMFRADVLRRFPYREFLRSGVDFNMIVRMANAGYKFEHTGRFHILRRKHTTNLTHTTSTHQKGAAARTLAVLRHRNSPPREKVLRNIANNLPAETIGHEDRLDDLLLYLPDHLVERDATLVAPSSIVKTLTQSFSEDRVHVGAGWWGKEENRKVPVRISNVTHADLARLRKLVGPNYEVTDASAGSSDGASQQIIASLPECDLVDGEKFTRLSTIPVGAEKPDDQQAGKISGSNPYCYWNDGSEFTMVVARWAEDIDEVMALGRISDRGDEVILPPRSSDEG